MTDLYKVERIIGKRIRDSKFIEYKVKWQGYSNKQSTWQPVKHLKTVQNLIEEFEERNKDKLPKTDILNIKTEPIVSSKTDRSHSLQKNFTPKGEELKVKKPIAKGVKIEEKIVKRSSNRLVSKKDENSPKKITDLVDIDDIQISDGCENDNDPGTPENPISGPELMGVDLKFLANKILETAEEKKKYPKIVNIQRDEQGNITYVLEDASGRLEQKQKKFIMENMSAELIDFYESKLNIS